MLDLEGMGPPLLHHEVSDLQKNSGIMTVPETELEDTVKSYREDKPKVDEASSSLPSLGHRDKGEMLAPVPDTIHPETLLQTLSVD